MLMETAHARCVVLTSSTVQSMFHSSFFYNRQLSQTEMELPQQLSETDFEIQCRRHKMGYNTHISLQNHVDEIYFKHKTNFCQTRITSSPSQCKCYSHIPFMSMTCVNHI